MTEGSSTESKPLLDHHGKPIPPRKSLLDRCKALSRKTKVVIASVIGLIACIAALLSNVHTIQQFFQSKTPPPSVPPIVVEVANSSEEPVDIVPRGDFFLWLPGPGAYHTIGKYEMQRLDSNTPDLEIITVGASSKVRVLAHVMNQDLYGQVLEQGDCDIAFMVRKAKGGHKATDNLPFTKEGISKYCASVDIGSD